MLLLGSDAISQSVGVEYLVVGGGGRGGAVNLNQIGPRYAGGGGGAGGALTGTRAVNRGDLLQLEVGNQGGRVGFPYPIGTELPAGDSLFADIVAFGGGRGGNAAGGNGQPGGSGGGGASGDFGDRGVGGAGVSGQGNAGVNGSGGGGPGGGLALISLITGDGVMYAVGGNSQAPSGDIFAPDNTGNGGSFGDIYSGYYINVEGAGTSAANGLYRPSGDFQGQIRYRLTGSNEWYIIFRAAVGWEIATLSEDNYLEQYMLNRVDADDPGPVPPPSGPAFAVAGDNPAPSIESQDAITDPTNGASGVVILAMPASVQVAISGLSYERDVTSRPGLAVYKFISGSGAIQFL
jgi:hypothetical protein